MNILLQSGQVNSEQREPAGAGRGGQMTTLTIELPDELAEEARTKGPPMTLAETQEEVNADRLERP